MNYQEKLTGWGQVFIDHLKATDVHRYRRLRESGQIANVAFDAQERVKDQYQYLTSRGMPDEEAEEQAVRQYILETGPHGEENQPEEWEVEGGQENVTSLFERYLRSLPR